MTVHYLKLPTDPQEAHGALVEHIHRYFPSPNGIAVEGTFTPRQLVNELVQRHGFSVHDKVGDAHTKGFMVSLPGREERYPLQEIEARPDILESYVEDHQATLQGIDRYFGAWMSNRGWTAGWVCLDISVYEPDLRTALKLAEAYQQDAIYDLATKKSPWVADLLRTPQLVTSRLIVTPGRIYTRNPTVFRDQVGAMARKHR
jgi:hypothetical protein